eukprot:9623130-Lingulodinium_polyedra.AAC.1
MPSKRANQIVEDGYGDAVSGGGRDQRRTTCTGLSVSDCNALRRQFRPDGLSQVPEDRRALATKKWNEWD